MTFRPILGASVQALERLRYPLLASYKLDGIRAIWWGKEFISRTLKTIPNRALQIAARDAGIPSGWDGELIVGHPGAKDVYRRTNSFCMSEEKFETAPARFFVFDHSEHPGIFADRHASLRDLPPLVVKLDHVLVSSPDEVLSLEQRALAEGFEGLVLRDPRGPYKRGRSTLREQYLLKLKRFTDAEAKVIGFEELMHNANSAETDERGYAKRSSHQANLVPMGTLGALVCDLDGVQFRIGTGFTQADRAHIWANRAQYLGAWAKFKSLHIGVKDAPRHPVWLGWRAEIDR